MGTVDELNADGTVASSYPTAWATTLRPQWGMTALLTSRYGFGAASLFPWDCFGHPIQAGNASRCPFPADAAAAADVVNAVGALWQSVFQYAHALGVQTCIGTEAPMTTPPPPPPPAPVPTPQQYYEGALTRLVRLLNDTLDFYWTWCDVLLPMPSVRYHRGADVEAGT